jgi:NADH:ubiquinone oxidoreductase subunit F (NADH-binding)/(2Fe-2S) ferredoxin/Pyruvate/2-oxoacid:ferredoxin oxidoreductase delta subunit
MKLTGIDHLDSVRTLLIDKKTDIPTISLCGGTGCRASESEKLLILFKKVIADKKLDITIKETGCHGLCENGPLMVIRPDNIFYQRLKPADIEEIIERTLIQHEIIDRLLFEEPETGIKIQKENQIPFYKKQKRLIFAQNGHINPKSIEDYISSGGYSALSSVLSGLKPEEVIDEVKKSGLRGRGGGGFPTGRKWQSCRRAVGIRKYVVCNADEGDPGAYMDRSLLEGNPHSVIEGMLIGAFAIGAQDGYVYVRAEYPLAVENITRAISDARAWGLLGTDILGSEFSFNITVTRGGGAFVCGESTALMQSLEGNSGEPRTKHVHTVESGLYNMPTNLNNVETWANIPIIINKGAEWYGKIGTKGSKGTKIFSLVGKVRNTGLIEIPMGMTLREIIYDIGGGIPDNKEFKAVQTGGPSGGCIPTEYLDQPVDFDKLTSLGSMMGSGGMIVMDEESCMVETARFYLNFLVEESCGKCTPCREGLWQMLSILIRITRGEGIEEDLSALEEIGEMVKDCSLCALGKTAPNPVLSTLRYFRQEYLDHIVHKKCPSGVCRSLFQYRIEKDHCTGCTLCRVKCPYNAITGEKKELHTIDSEKCQKCGICFEVCRFDAVKKVAL